MKTGILTFHAGANYGGFLQAWHLREAVRSLGHEAEIINYKNADHAAAEAFRWRLTPRVRRMFRDWRRHAVFADACRELVSGTAVTDPAGIDWAAYDAIVVGSDVVWDYQSPQLGQDGAYFGAVPGGEAVRWVSYAPSCGKADPADPLPEDKAEGLKRFAAISVRDRGTQDLVRNATGREAPLVVDPTWLVESEGETPLEETDPVLAVYSYKAYPAACVASIRRFASRHGLEVVAYGYARGWADRSVCNLDPFGWVEAFRRARCIVTGTFHGTLYAIRLDKVFATIDHEWIRNKVSYPLGLLGLEDRLVGEGGSLEDLLEAQLAAGAPGSFGVAADLRASSFEFLRSALHE